MPDVKISALPTAQTGVGGALANGDLFSIIQSAGGATLQTRHLTYATLVLALSTALGIGTIDSRITALEAGGPGGGGALDPTLQALADVTVAANKLIYATGADAFTTTDFTAFGRQVIAAVNAGGLKTLLTLAVADIAGAAPLDSPTFTGTPNVPTAAQGTSTSQAASTAFVVTEVLARIAALVNSSPTTLDTLNELAAALGNDPNFATTITTALGLKAPLDSPTFTGTPTAPTAPAGTDTNQIATMAALQAAKKDALPQVVVAAGQTLTLTRAAHQGATIILGGAGAGFTLDATAQGAGFSCAILNRTGSDYSFPAITGATRIYDRDASHSKLLQGGQCSLEVLPPIGGTTYCALIGSTGV